MSARARSVTKILFVIVITVVVTSRSLRQDQAFKDLRMELCSLYHGLGVRVRVMVRLGYMLVLYVLILHRRDRSVLWVIDVVDFARLNYHC